MYVNKLINGCHFLDNNLNWIIYQTCIIFSLKTSEYLFSAKKSSSKTFFQSNPNPNMWFQADIRPVWIGNSASHIEILVTEMSLAS